MPTDVYFIAAGDPPEAVKIGYASDVTQRFANIQTGNHLPVRLLGTVPGDRYIERLIHHRFAHLRLRGEWFRWDPSIEVFLASRPDPPFSELHAGSPFVGLLGRGYPNSFYRAYAQDPSGQWWRFAWDMDPTCYDPIEHQLRRGERAAETLHGPLVGAASYEGKPDNYALLHLLARAREVAA